MPLRVVGSKLSALGLDMFVGPRAPDRWQYCIPQSCSSCQKSGRYARQSNLHRHGAPLTIGPTCEPNSVKADV